MKIICCKCKKEYSLEDNIHKYDKANRPILICPHCGFKHIINFMPFEGKIKTEKIKELNLGAYYPVTIGASRIANATRVDQSGVDDGDISKDVGWNVGTAVYDNKSVDAGSPGEPNPNGVAFNSDGTKMYILGGFYDSVYEMDLSTPWDISTAVYNSHWGSIGSEVQNPSGFAFKPDGSKMYVTDTFTDTVYQYTLTTPWDITTTTYASKSKDVSDQGETFPNSIAFNPDGDKMYIAGAVKNTVYQYTLSTPWDVSTATYASKSKLITDQGETYTTGVAFSSDGKMMYTVGTDNDTVYQYVLDTAWDVSPAVYSGRSKLISDQGETNPTGVAFKSDGLKMYIVGSYKDMVYQYKLGAAWDRDNDFILATRIWGSKGPHVQAFKLRWRIVGGTFADVGATGEITYNAVTDLVDGNAVIIGERLCDFQSGYTWQDGEESEGDNILPDAGTYSLADEYYTELQWALDCSNAKGGATYEFELWDVTEGSGVSLGTCLAKIQIEAEKDVIGKASITSNLTANVQVTSGGPVNRTGKASLTSSVIVVLSRGKIEGATAKASISSSMIALLNKEPKNATGKASITTLLSAILARGKIENATAKSEITTNMTSILSRGKIEDRTGKAELTSLMQALLSNFINATGKASIDTNVDITLARGKIENTTGKAGIVSSFTSILSRGHIENTTGKASITSNIDSILSRGKIENVTGKASISSLIISILSRGKIENTSGKAEIETSVIIILNRGAIKNATGKAGISTNINSQIRTIRKATAKSSMTSLIDITLSRGKIENTTGKASIDSSIIIALSRGKIESVTGKASITSGIIAVLSRGQIESVTGKASIDTVFNTILNRGAIENASGKASIISNLTAILQKEGAIDATGKASITTNIEAKINRIIARAGKASLETSYNAILSRGKIKNVNGKAFIYTSINANIITIKRATGKASINSFIHIPLKRLINASGRAIFDTLMEIEITREFAFSQAELSITANNSALSLERTATKLGITKIENDIKIER